MSVTAELEKRMVEVLGDLAANYGVVGIKASTEDEGLVHEELLRLKSLGQESGLPIALKIGGPEAEADVRFATVELGASGIVAPMVESPYGLHKYLKLAQEYTPDGLKVGVNIETIQACSNFPQMLGLEDIERLNSVTVGRVDLVGSLGLSRGDINNDHVYWLASGVFRLAKGKDLVTNLGGGITPRAIPFIKKLLVDGLLDKYETRNIIFSASDGLKDAVGGMVRANVVEILWLKIRLAHCPEAAPGDRRRIQKRIEMMMGRREAEGYSLEILPT